MIPNANSLLENLPRINNEQEDAIANEFPQYAFYERIKNGVEYYCTSCHRWQKNSSDMRTFSAPTIWKHNQLYTCPYCGKQVVAKSAGRGHKTLENKGHFIVYTAYKQRLYAFVIKAYQSFCNEEFEPDYFLSNQYLYVFEKNHMQRFTWTDDSNSRHNIWRPLKSDKGLPQWSYITNTDYEDSIAITPEQIYETDLKYSEMETFSSEAYIQIEYLIKYIKHNNLEYIVKAGFTDIAKDIVLRWNDTKIIKWKSNNLLKMLGIRKQDIDLVKLYNIQELKAYQYAIKNIPNADNIAEIVRIIYSFGIDYIEEIKNLTNLSINQIFKYAKTIQRLSQWKDYLYIASKLPGGIGEIKPKNLQAAHDRVLTESNFFAKKHQEEQIQNRFKQLQPLLFETNELIMKIPKSGTEIILEGKILQHCVGSYVQRHADSKTNILFIRKKDEPDVPYFTIEVSNNYHIVQCHGYRNEAVCPKPDEIIEFEKQYTKFLEELRNERSQRNAVCIKTA